MSVSARLGIGLMRALAHVPLPVLRGVSGALGRVLHVLARSRRRVVDVNLALCFPQLSADERHRVARETFVYVAQAWFDRAWLWHGPRAVVERRLTVRAAPELLRELNTGTDPLILFAPHFYGLDAAATALTMGMTRPSMTIYTTQRDPMIDAWAREGRTRFGNVRAFDRAAGPKPVAARLRRGEVLYLLPDMDFGPSQSVFVPFFGVPAATVPSLSRFARMGRAKVMPALSRFTPTGYEIELLPAWTDFPSDDAVADTALMNRRLEEYIRTMPSQYYWVHRRFKTRPEGEAPVYRKKR